MYVAHTKGSGSTFTGIGKDGPVEMSGGSGGKYIKVQRVRRDVARRFSSDRY